MLNFKLTLKIVTILKKFTMQVKLSMIVISDNIDMLLMFGKMLMVLRLMHTKKSRGL
jgi:ABC-type dipeptide/oligopeptide/nickel transport system ATPase subunit